MLDTKTWRPELLAAVRRELTAFAGGSEPRFVFQSYGEKDIKAVAGLAKEVGAGLILTLYQRTPSIASCCKWPRSTA